MQRDFKEVKEKAKYQLRARPTIITALLLLLQVALLVGAAYYVKHIEYLSVALVGLGAALIIYIANRDINDAYKISWFIPMAVMPIFGALLYFFLHTLPGTGSIIRRLTANMRMTKRYLTQDEKALEALADFDEGGEQIARYTSVGGPWPVYQASDATYFPDGMEAFEDIIQSLKKAERFIFMEFFIVKPGKIWDAILDVLEERIQHGVQVRFMYDGICSFSLPENFKEDLEARGIEVNVFAPVKPVIATWVNNRDHRKILVIDGQIGYTGGINLADEYANLENPFGHWKDVAVKIEGEAVRSMLAQFLQMWHINDSLNEQELEYLLSPRAKEVDHPAFILPYADAPEDGHSMAENIVIALLYHARKKVHMMTPYLVLSGELKRALCFAAERGIDTRVIIPHIPDKKIPFAVARSYYPELLHRGVKIYEYTPGFVHAKVVTSDDVLTTVGTVNLDFRSLYLNFENGVLIADEKVAAQVEKDFEETLSLCHEVSLADYQRIPLFWRGVGRVARIFGPLI